MNKILLITAYNGVEIDIIIDRILESSRDKFYIQPRVVTREPVNNDELDKFLFLNINQFNTKQHLGHFLYSNGGEDGLEGIIDDKGLINKTRLLLCSDEENNILEGILKRRGYDVTTLLINLDKDYQKNKLDVINRMNYTSWIKVLHEDDNIDIERYDYVVDGQNEDDIYNFITTNNYGKMKEELS